MPLGATTPEPEREQSESLSGTYAQARREHARKIDPRYSEGDLVKVAGGGNQANAEMIQLLLLDGGVPSILQRSGGFDVPDFLAAGPRDVMVPRSGAAAAREILGEMAAGDISGAQPKPMRLLIGLLAGVVFAAIVVVLLDAAT
jgi:hypothetical protein